MAGYTAVCHAGIRGYSRPPRIFKNCRKWYCPNSFCGILKSECFGGKKLGIVPLLLSGVWCVVRSVAWFVI